MKAFSGRFISRCLLLTLFFLLNTSPVQADIGPKPTMQFTFEYNIDPVAIVSGQQIECEDEECLTSAPLEELGPQGFSCEQDSCSSRAYGYSDYHKLVIEFEDGTRESNVFSTSSFDAEFTVTVTEDVLVVKENKGGLPFNLDNFCCFKFLATIGLETIIASIFLAAFHLPKAFLGLVPCASIITLPLVWFAFPLLPISSSWITGLSEVTAVSLEALFLYFAAFRSISFKDLLLISAVMNGISFAIGLLL